MTQLQNATAMGEFVAVVYEHVNVRLRSKYGRYVRWWLHLQPDILTGNPQLTVYVQHRGGRYSRYFKFKAVENNALPGPEEVVTVVDYHLLKLEEEIDAATQHVQ